MNDPYSYSTEPILLDLFESSTCFTETDLFGLDTDHVQCTIKSTRSRKIDSKLQMSKCNIILNAIAILVFINEDKLRKTVNGGSYTGTGRCFLAPQRKSKVTQGHGKLVNFP